MNFSAIGVIAGRRENVASRISRDCGATITCEECAILVKDHETWDASNLEPRTQVVLAFPVAVVQGQIGKNVLWKSKASTCALSRAMNSRTDVQFRHLLNELCRQEVDSCSKRPWFPSNTSTKLP